MAGWKPREELMLQFKSEGSLLQNSLLLRGGQSFVLFRPSTDWRRPTCIVKGNLLYSKSTDLNVNFISLPLVQVPSLFFCLCYFFFLLPYPSTWGVSCLLGGLTSSASVRWVFYRSSSTCRCISDVFVGRKVISASYSSAIFSPPLENSS